MKGANEAKGFGMVMGMPELENGTLAQCGLTLEQEREYTMHIKELAMARFCRACWVMGKYFF